MKFSRLRSAAVLLAALAAGCDWSGNIRVTVSTDDLGTSPSSDVAASDAMDNADASTDTAPAMDAAPSDVVATDAMHHDHAAPTDASTDTVTPPADSATDAAPDASVPDFVAGTDCRRAGLGAIRACAAATSCLGVLQFCEASTATWTPCVVWSNTCSAPDAGPMGDASTPTDASVDVMLHDHPDSATDASAPTDAPGMPSALCPCSGDWCELVVRCTTRCGNPGSQLVRQYCSQTRGFCTPLVPGQC